MYKVSQKVTLGVSSVFLWPPGILNFVAQIFTLFIQIFDVCFLARYKTVENADDLFHRSAHWIRLVVLQQFHFHFIMGWWLGEW